MSLIARGLRLSLIALHSWLNVVRVAVSCLGLHVVACGARWALLSSTPTDIFSPFSQWVSPLQPCPGALVTHRRQYASYKVCELCVALCGRPANAVSDCPSAVCATPSVSQGMQCCFCGTAGRVGDFGQPFSWPPSWLPVCACVAALSPRCLVLRCAPVEIDKTLKKIQEGVESFDAVWDKVRGAPFVQGGRCGGGDHGGRLDSSCASYAPPLLFCCTVTSPCHVHLQGGRMVM